MGISPQQYRGYRDRMATCLGFDAAAAAPLAPRLKLLVVDRLYSSGGCGVGDECSKGKMRLKRVGDWASCRDG